MKVLAVETATAWQSVAIVEGEKALARCDQEAGGAHAKLLLGAIDRLFKETGLNLASLDGLAVSIGPGSFTGLRVGLATMLGFRMITQLPLAVVPTLEGMAWTLRGSAAKLCPVLNSRRGELYWGIFQWAGLERLERIVPEQVGPPIHLAKQLSGAVVLYGEGWLTEQTAIRAAMAREVAVMEMTGPVKPSAVSVGMAGIAKLERGERAGIGVSPFYVQSPEAVLKYEKAGGVSPVARRQEKVTKKLKKRMTLASERRRPRS